MTGLFWVRVTMMKSNVFQAYRSLSKMSFTDLVDTVTGLIADECVVGWFQGRMEFGPRALGHRSILADPRLSSMQRVKFKNKYREFFALSLQPYSRSV